MYGLLSAFKMAAIKKNLSWIPVLQPGNGPIYASIADALAVDISSGKLARGQALPTHRELAKALGIDLTTVTRAYNEARRRGLTDSQVGRGTFVRRTTPDTAAIRPRTALESTMNAPPQPKAAELGRHLTQALAAIERRDDFLDLLTYRQTAGSDEDRAAGAEWLRPLLPALTPDRVLVCNSAQSALLALITTLVRPGDVVLTEALCYPGFRAVAAHFGIPLRGVAMDEEGIIPGALDAACRQGGAKALYCVPTIQNPTTATMSLSRREAIVAVARRHGIVIIEDDAYGLLPRHAPTPLARLAPDITFYVCSLAKTLTPAFRIAYLVTHDAEQTTALGAALRATTMMASPLMAAMATQWITEGTARAVLNAIRDEATARQRIASDILRASAMCADPAGHHLWLTLPTAWSRSEFVGYARDLDLVVLPSDAFAVSEIPPNAVRVSLGTAKDQEALRRSLQSVAMALARAPTSLSSIV